MGGVRAAFMRMLGAHIDLLRAELELAGREIGIIAGLAFGALFIAILVAILLYVGGFLFFGELLFGSMGWGIIHGTLLGAVFVAFVAIDLAGGDLSRYGWGAVAGLVAAVVLVVLLLSNVGNESGEWTRRFLVEEFQTEQLPFGDEWLVMLSGLVVGALAGLVLGLVAVWRAALTGSARTGAIVGLAVAVGVAGAIYAATRYEAPDGVLGLAVMVGLLTWIIAGIALAYQAGFDPEARYADLIPRESIAAATRTKEFLLEQWERQKRRMMGR